MSVTEDTNKVILKINNAYNRRIAAVYFIAQYWAARALNRFRQNQRRGNTKGTKGAYWTNQSFEAADAMFSEAFKELTTIGFFISHGVDYGVYLERSNNRRHESLRIIIGLVLRPFVADIKKIYKD